MPPRYDSESGGQEIQAFDSFDNRLDELAGGTAVDEPVAGRESDSLADFEVAVDGHWLLFDLAGAQNRRLRMPDDRRPKRPWPPWLPYA